MKNGLGVCKYCGKDYVVEDSTAYSKKGYCSEICQKVQMEDDEQMVNWRGY